MKLFQREKSLKLTRQVARQHNLHAPNAAAKVLSDLLITRDQQVGTSGGGAGADWP